jgi:hypothetical protein
MQRLRDRRHVRHNAYVGVIAALMLPLLGCGNCLYEPLGVAVPSPDGRYSVQAFEMNCHATTGFETIVRITDSNAWWRTESTAARFKHYIPTRLSWRDAETVVVDYYACLKDKGRISVEEQASGWKGLVIDVHEGQPLPRDAPGC